MFSTARHKLHSTAMPASLTIARRFRGPRTSANGGYAAGCWPRPSARRAGRGDAAAAAAARAAARGDAGRRARCCCTTATRSSPRRAAATRRSRRLAPAERSRRPSRRSRDRRLGRRAPEFDECFVCGTAPTATGSRSTPGACRARRRRSSRRPGSPARSVPRSCGPRSTAPAPTPCAATAAASRCSRGSRRAIDRLPGRGRAVRRRRLAARRGRAQAPCRDGALRGGRRRARRLAAALDRAAVVAPGRQADSLSRRSVRLGVRGVSATSSPPSSS